MILLSSAQSIFSHVLDFGQPTELEQIAIEGLYPCTIYIDTVPFKLSDNCVYEVTDVTIERIVIGDTDEDKAVFTYRKSGDN